MRFLILGMNFTDDTAICDLGTLGDLVPVDEKTSISYLYVPKSFENASDLIGRALDTFQFDGALN